MFQDIKQKELSLFKNLFIWKYVPVPSLAVSEIWDNDAQHDLSR